MDNIINTIFPEPPYDFDLTVGYHTYYRSRYGTDYYVCGEYRRLLNIGNKLILDDLRPNIWIAVFAGSSISRKSTALRLGGIPFRNVQKSFKEGDKIILSSDFSDAGFFQMMQNFAAPWL